MSSRYPGDPISIEDAKRKLRGDHRMSDMDAVTPGDRNCLADAEQARVEVEAEISPIGRHPLPDL